MDNNSSFTKPSPERLAERAYLLARFAPAELMAQWREPYISFVADLEAAGTLVSEDPDTD